MKRIALIVALLALPTGNAFAQEAIAYRDGHGGRVLFPWGERSFADEVISYTPGTPPPSPERRDASQALRGPAPASRFVALGCGGELVVRFNDNVLVNVAGPDLFIFEVGQEREPTDVAVSVDGEDWVELGEVAGATAAIDIAPRTDSFLFVRLRDRSDNCGPGAPGADINAVGAIGAGRGTTITSSVLFETDRSDLRPEAEAALAEVVAEIQRLHPVRIVVSGHTDSTASDAHNERLSEARARSVAAFLSQRESLGSDTISSIGYGERWPIAGNDTDADRARNRRVEVLLVHE